MATIKQKIAYKEVVRGSTLVSAMKKAGYSESTSKRTNKLTRTEGWKELTEQFLSDKELVQKHTEQLNSSKHSKLYFDIDDDDELIKKVCKQLGVELLFIKVNKAGDGKTVNVKQPDFFFRDLALDKAYKIKGRYTEPAGGNKTLILVVSNETAKRYDLNKEPSTDSS